MSEPVLRDATRRDFATILALNEASVEHTSPLDTARLAALHEASAWHRVVEVDGKVAAFLLAFRECAAYDSPNYLWFCRRYTRFVYIDRVVVDAQVRSGGLGRLLYRDVIDYARRAEASALVCEYYNQPLNEVSARFHARFGFVEVGTQALPNGKRVSLQALELSSL